MPSDEASILAVNETFYAAFAGRDLTAMEALWAESRPVCCIHPGWGALHDRRSIMASWASILTGDEAPLVRCERVHVRIANTAATVICEEVLGDAHLAATNAFIHENGVWRMWHHHASPIARRVTPEPEPLLN